jgi:hypothetical protein
MAKPKTPIFAELNVDEVLKHVEEPHVDEPIAELDGSGSMPDTFVYASQESYKTHRFILQTSKVLKNDGLPKSPIYMSLDHQHVFRTVDSNGYEQVKSTATGGHFHLITMSDDKKTLYCSEAMTEKSIYDKRERRWKKEYQPVVVAGKTDGHVHKLTYVRTDEISKRKLSDKAAQFIAQEANRTIPVEGVIG